MKVQYSQLRQLTYQTLWCNNARHLHSRTWSGTHLQDNTALIYFKTKTMWLLFRKSYYKGCNMQLSSHWSSSIWSHHKSHKLEWSVCSRGFHGEAWCGRAIWLSAPAGRWMSPNCSTLCPQSRPADDRGLLAPLPKHRFNGTDTFNIQTMKM